MPTDPVSEEIRVIDAHYLAPRRMSIYLIVDNGRAVFVDNNTVHAVPYMLAALDDAGLAPEDVDYAVVTHVHLDHAGGTAALLAQCPNATALVHPKTRRHLANPARLVEASRQIYGDQFDAIYGNIEPVPEARMQTVADGDRLEWQSRQFTFFHTLGHASHHFCMYDNRADCVFAGDSFGIAYGELQGGNRPYIFAAATPTEFDPIEARRAVKQILSYNPARVCLGHYGCYENVTALAERLMYTIDLCEMLIDETAARNSDDESLRAWLHERTRFITEDALRGAGLTLTEENMRWVNPDIMLNAQGLLAAAKRKRRKQQDRGA